MGLVNWQGEKKMTETILSFLIVTCLILYRVVNHGVPDFLFHQPDQTACISMRYTSPWATIVDVDRYVKKSKYKKLTDENYDMKGLNIDITRLNIDYHFRFSKSNVLLFVKSKRNPKIHLAVLSYFVCVNSIQKYFTPSHVVLAYHVCDVKSKNTQSPSKFIRNIIGKIANEIPEFGNLLLNNKWIQNHITAHNCDLDPFVCIQSGLIYPLSKLTQKPAFKKIILISGIDQCNNLYNEHQGVSISLDVFLNKTIS